MFRVSTESPLRKPPQPMSERQIVLLDGIRYSLDMVGIAIDRLWQQLCFIDGQEDRVGPSDIAAAALDAWSVIDAAHRMSDLAESFPGLPNANWRRVFKQRMKRALELRNMWQHQVGQAPAVVRERGQAWGSLAWMQHREGKPTGRWFLAVIGSALKGSSWTFAGPAHAIERVGTRRIRLLHHGDEIYLSRLVRDMFEAAGHLERDLRDGKVRLVGDAMTEERSSDWVMESSMVVVMRP